MKRFLLFAAISTAAIILAAIIFRTESTNAAAGLPDPKVDLTGRSGIQTIVFAGGCFWCTEAVFEELKGVQKVVSGYAGGKASDARYETVSAGRTNHAESIQITYRPDQISYGTLLKVFFGVAHDPTQLNRQGPDWGRQYRSAIFYSTDEQKNVAEAYIRQLEESHVFGKKIVTEVVKLEALYPAEGYHQDFVRNNPTHVYVVANALPKLRKLRQQYPELVKNRS